MCVDEYSRRPIRHVHFSKTGRWGGGVNGCVWGGSASTNGIKDHPSTVTEHCSNEVGEREGTQKKKKKTDNAFSNYLHSNHSAIHVCIIHKIIPDNICSGS